MKKVIVGFSKPNTWKIGAELEMWWTNCICSHVYLRYSDDQNRDMVFQASHGTVHPQLTSNFLKENISVKEFALEFSPEEYQKMRDFYYNMMGEPYAYRDLAVIFIHDVFRKMKITFNDKSVPGYVCSSLVATMLAEV